MKINIFTLADYVSEQAGKLTIVGTFDRWVSPTFPFSTNPFGVAMKAYIEDSDYGNKSDFSFIIKSLAKKHNIIFRMDGTITYLVKKLKKVGTTSSIFMVGGIHFEKPGMYVLECRINNRVKSSFPI